MLAEVRKDIIPRRVFASIKHSIIEEDDCDGYYSDEKLDEEDEPK